MRAQLVNVSKNLLSWKTKRKLLLIPIDDYGNIRLDSAQARERMNKSGLKVHSMFDAYDTLESREDLEALFEVLDSVKDIHGNPACFTPFSLPCNLNFEKIAESDFQEFHIENLPSSFEKLAARYPNEYEGAWKLWQEGIKNGYFKPEYHGREHLNLKVFSEKLRKKDSEVLCSLKNRSYTSISNSGYSSISYTAAFQFWDFNENVELSQILADGIRKFEEVFGRKPKVFNPPGGREHHILHKTLVEEGIFGIESTFINKEHQGSGRYKRQLNFTGKKTNDGMFVQVRNAVFEPLDGPEFDINRAFRDIQLAFSMNVPAILSSHRVNFCGLIDSKLRKINLQKLKELLIKVQSKYPDVEFISTGDLHTLMRGHES